jgi:hypothetical protein
MREQSMLSHSGCNEETYSKRSRIKTKIISDLMDIANGFADGEDACNNKRT